MRGPSGESTLAVGRRLRILSFAIYTGALVGAAACGGGDDDGGGGIVGGGGVPDGGGGVPDGGGGGADGAQVACPSGGGAAEVAEESNFWDGPITACGTVTLPADAASSQLLQLLIYRVDGLGGNEFLGPGMTNTEKRVHFRIDLEAGEYKIGMRIDDNGDQVIGTGDLQGFYDGTLEAPLIGDAGAAVITLDGARTDLHFAVGRLE
jgi:hypothetical protein